MVAEPSKVSTSDQPKTLVVSKPKDQIKIELVGGLSYHLLAGPTFFKGRPQEVSRELGERLLATGLFRRVGDSSVSDTGRAESKGS